MFLCLSAHHVTQCMPLTTAMYIVASILIIFTNMTKHKHIHNCIAVIISQFCMSLQLTSAVTISVCQQHLNTQLKWSTVGSTTTWLKQSFCRSIRHCQHMAEYHAYHHYTALKTMHKPHRFHKLKPTFIRGTLHCFCPRAPRTLGTPLGFLTKLD